MFFSVFLLLAGRQPVLRRPLGAGAVPGQRAPVRRALPRGVRASAALHPLRGARRCWPSSWRCRRRRTGRNGCCSATASPSASPTRSSTSTSASTCSSCRSSSFAIDWLFAALVIVLLLTMAAHLLNGGVLFTSSTPTVRPATRVHFAVLLALLAAVKAADYWLTRYALTNEHRGFVQGATYTVVNAQIPALMLLMLIALLTAGLFLWTIRSNRGGCRSWPRPVARDRIGGRLRLSRRWCSRSSSAPTRATREAPYIDRNVDATRPALGIDDVDVQQVSRSSDLTADDVQRTSSRSATCACSTRPRCCRGSRSTVARRPASRSPTSTSIGTCSTPTSPSRC